MKHNIGLVAALLEPNYKYYASQIKVNNRITKRIQTMSHLPIYATYLIHTNNRRTLHLLF